MHAWSIMTIVNEVVIAIYSTHWLTATGTKSCAANPHKACRQQESEYPQANMQANTLTDFVSSALFSMGFPAEHLQWALRAVSPAEASVWVCRSLYECCECTVPCKSQLVSSSHLKLLSQWVHLCNSLFKFKHCIVLLYVASKSGNM